MVLAPAPDDFHLMIGSARPSIRPRHTDSEEPMLRSQRVFRTRPQSQCPRQSFAGTLPRVSRYSAVYADITVGIQFNDRPYETGETKVQALLSDAEPLAPSNGSAVDPASRDHPAAQAIEGRLEGAGGVRGIGRVEKKPAGGPAGGLKLEGGVSRAKERSLERPGRSLIKHGRAVQRRGQQVRAQVVGPHRQTRDARCRHTCRRHRARSGVDRSTESRDAEGFPAGSGQD